MNHELLSLLTDARLNRQSQPRELNYEELYQLSDQHQVSALIYNQIYHFPDFPPEIKNKWKTETLKINAFQTMRTQKLLDIYQKINQQHIPVLIVKGIICRSLYPQPDYRQSNDEDLYIQKEHLETIKEILFKDHFQISHESDDVITFIDFTKGLSLEVHTSLFSEESQAYGQYQNLFNKAFQHTKIHTIDNVNILSLDDDYHFLFLILHFVKHFLHSGVGIRQVIDIIMYAEAYGELIHWDKIIEILKYYHIYDLIMNVFSLAYHCLEFDYKKTKLSLHDIENRDYQDLLNDIMNAGIFGQSTEERLHSSTMTLNALENGKVNVFKSIFPTLKEMQGKYEYLHKYPFLLPISYISRIYHYFLNNESKNSKQTIEIGQQRVELLKKYKVIK